MTLAALAFAAGAALLQLQAALPPLPWAWLVVPLGVAAIRWRSTAVAFALASGFFWAAACAHWRMADWLDPALEGRDVALVGVVSGLPAAGERSLRFELEVESAAARLPRRLLLSWYGNPDEQRIEVHPGERWALTVRLRRPHGSVNPHGFDYAAWLL